MQFTGLATLAFADVAEPSMGSANIWFSVAFQLANGFGVAVGALALRLAGTVTGTSTGIGTGTGPGTDAASFHWAFAGLVVAMAAAALTGLRLRADAGTVVSGHQARRPA